MLRNAVRRVGEVVEASLSFSNRINNIKDTRGSTSFPYFVNHSEREGQRSGKNRQDLERVLEPIEDASHKGTLAYPVCAVSSMKYKESQDLCKQAMTSRSNFSIVLRLFSAFYKPCLKRSVVR